MGALLAVVYLIAWIPLVFAGRRLGRKWGNPDAGLWLPALLGALGFAIFAAGSRPAAELDHQELIQVRRHAAWIGPAASASPCSM